MRTKNDAASFPGALMRDPGNEDENDVKRQQGKMGKKITAQSSVSDHPKCQA